MSKNTNYKRGRTFEYRVREYYQKLGFHVLRSYASKGAADLYAMKECHTCSDCINTNLLLIQCKNYDTTKRKFPHDQAEELRSLARKTGGKPVLVSNIRHKLHIETL